jgi:hypothetical protein
MMEASPAADTHSTPPSDDKEPSQTGSQQSSITEQAFVDRIRKSDQWMIALTAVIAIGGLISAIIFGYQLREMQTAGDLTRESIRISADALKISRETLIAAERPWISIAMTILGPLTFSAKGAEISIGVELKNHGHSPAMNVRNFVVFDPTGGQKGHDFCEFQRVRTAAMFAQVVFPNETILRTHIAHADISEFEKAAAKYGATPSSLTACVDYVSTFDDIRHQTQLTADLYRAAPSPEGFALINPSDGSVPQANLRLSDVFGSHNAN